MWKSACFPGAREIGRKRIGNERINKGGIKDEVRVIRQVKYQNLKTGKLRRKSNSRHGQQVSLC